MTRSALTSLRLARLAPATLLLVALGASPLLAQTPGNLYVSAVNGSDTNPGTSTFPLKSIRAAVAALNPSTLTTIWVRGRLLPGTTTIALHDEAIETWSAGPIVVPPNARIVWDSANSDTLGATTIGGPTIQVPAVLAGTPDVTTFAFLIDGSANPGAVFHTPYNTRIEGLKFNNFQGAIEIQTRPEGSTATARKTQARLKDLTFNQCSPGVRIFSDADEVSPILRNCDFLNEPLGPGEGFSVPTVVQLHCWLNARGTSILNPEIVNCLFRTGQNGLSAPTMGDGIFLRAGGGAAAAPMITGCVFDGSFTATSLTNAFQAGMQYGFRMRAIGTTLANPVIDDCWFDGCASDGVLLVASGQITVPIHPETGDVIEGGGSSTPPLQWEPPETSFTKPVVKNSSFSNSGRRAVRTAPLFVATGYGVATWATQSGGLWATVENCVPGGEVQGRAKVGITRNGFAGVLIQSDFVGPAPDGTFEFPTFTIGDSESEKLNAQDYVDSDPNGESPFGRFAMLSTWNNTQVISNEIYDNGELLDLADGVTILFDFGCGNCFVDSNEIRDNEMNGVFSFTAGLNVERDIDVIRSLPKLENNRIHSTVGGSPLGKNQNRGILTVTLDEKPLGLSNVVAPIGYHHNTIVNNTVIGWEMFSPKPPLQGFAAGNIIYFNGTQDLNTLAWRHTHFSCLIPPLGGFNITNISTDPALGPDLRLTGASPCIDLVPINLLSPLGESYMVSDDYDGEARAPRGVRNDMGADEH